jgi:dipeptidyl aminopeptidase/acylaminoacyl peptidase
MIVHVGSADQPGAYYYYDTNAGAMSLLSKVSSRFSTKTHLGPVKTIHYKARDGLDIAAVLTLPVGSAAKDLPLILMPHGGPFARDSEDWDWWVQFLAWRGYAVLQPNYRGSSGYGTAFAEKGEGQWGLAMQDDLNDAVDWAVKQGIADPKRVCMVGASYGGYAAMRAAQRDPAKYRCAVSYAGVSDLAAMMRYDRRFLNHSTRQDWLKEQAPDFASVSPVHFASQFATPILLMHGKKDRRVQVNQSREMAEKLKAAGKVEGRDYIYVEQPLADHHFSREADRLEFLEQMDAFLKAHNPA